jgi:uncharacterized membrane-anchored protein
MKKLLVLVALGLMPLITLAQKSPQEIIAGLNWQSSPAVGKVGDRAEVKLTGTLEFLDAPNTADFLKANGNLPNATSYTLVNNDGKANWFAILRYVDDGYVKDDEKIDPDALLKSLQENNVLGNEQKRKQGLPTLTLVGWYFPPRYDPETKRLEWGTKLQEDSTKEITVNVNTKILGRSGYTTAILVSSPESLETDLRDFKQAIKGFDYVSGEKYREWKEGDKVAAYGLGALVLGGAAAVATKKGGLKLLWVGALALFAAVWAGLKKLGKK